MGDLKEEKAVAEEEKVKEELQQANISLVIDTYDDIFSDFDPRPFSERALSDDFLLECKNAAHDKGGGLELVFSVPRDKRSINDEFKIRKRLREHFKKHSLEKEDEMSGIKKEGLLWVFLGVVVMFVVLFGFVKTTSVLLQSILTVLEVPSWFLIWEGMGKLFFESKKLIPDYGFYKKMSSAVITFRSY